MIYKCKKCERVYNKKQLNLIKKLEGQYIISLEYQCPLCNVNDFELQKEIYINKEYKIRSSKVVDIPLRSEENE